MVSIQIYSGARGIGEWIVIYGAVQSVQDGFVRLFEGMLEMGISGNYIDDYETVMHFDEEENAKQYNETMMPESVDIRFENVVFRYPGNDYDVLNGITVDIRQGEKIAIVGENGSGKSTFVALLSGLYSPDSGSIRVGGLEPDKNTDFIRNVASFIYQNFGKYYFTVSDNIKIGCISGDLTMDEIMEAARITGADSFIQKYASEYETYIGNIEEGGVELSGGEWQKIALARALVNKNARVMVLDEPTAALDPIAESRFYEEYEKLTGGNTAIMISHRLGSTKIANRILVFKDGRIIEDGNHENLMEKNGEYARMFKAQAQWYV